MAATLRVSHTSYARPLNSGRTNTLMIHCCPRRRGTHVERTINIQSGKKPYHQHGKLSHRSVTCNIFWKNKEVGRVNEAEAKAREKNENEKEKHSDRPPFDLNLAVVLAGFAFEAYTTPSENAGIHEVDSSGCKTIFLSEHFLHEVYDGQLSVQLVKGLNLPAMDPWGTSDPYVIINVGDIVVKSKVIWATKEPHWNESFQINVKDPSHKYLQLAVWDANFVSPHKRMGNGGIKLESLCDGNSHEIQVDLEGMGGGGHIFLQIRYRSFEDLKFKKDGWKIPFISDISLKSGLASALKSVFGSDSVKAREFVHSAFGKIQPLFAVQFPQNNPKEGKFLQGQKSVGTRFEKKDNDSSGKGDMEEKANSASILQKAKTEEGVVSNENTYENKELLLTTFQTSSDKDEEVKYATTSTEHDFWKVLSDSINHAIENLGENKFVLPTIDNFRWNANDMIKSLGMQSQTIADQKYVGSGLATPQEVSDSKKTPVTTDAEVSRSTLIDVKEASVDILRQTENILGSLMMLTTSLTGQKDTTKENDNKNSNLDAIGDLSDTVSMEEGASITETETLDDAKFQQMKEMFATAETAMEAWAMLATKLGRSSFIKSEFEKLCFLDNDNTDTQLAVWRDNSQRRLVVAFRGTEQARWKDLRTDLMLAPSGLNPERVGGDFKKEMQVHSGFLGAYDSVRSRLLSLIKSAVYFREREKDKSSPWHVYVTGHSLGGALATLLALELSTSQMAKCGFIKVTMYNFGSPRVGNKWFAEEYNKRVKDSWRVVNHRDIIPSVPRLMGYCHVDQPIYLSTTNLNGASVEVDVLEDAHDGVVIGEYTPDVLVSEFMKGEKQLLDKLVQTEINLFRAIRDGSALMQHMEDFYYITLLQNVRSKYLKQ